tara:strand:+ start:4143 stop:4517 length:375 start_codon:yes stop_codon:yes gene_type:complete
MGLSKISRKFSNKIKPAERIANKIVRNSPAILQKTSDVLGKSGAVLDKVGSISTKVLTNPAVAGFVGATAPELLPVLGSAVIASSLISKAGNTADKLSSVSGRASNSIERIQNKGTSQQGVTFA